ncbi:unnamed protein product, partial [Ectocarpus sp. 12 AP-2014]
KITLRPFTGADIGTLAALHRASRVSMQLFDEPFSVSKHASYIAGLAVGCAVTVAEKAGKPIGFLAYARKPDDAAGLISHLFVQPDHQRQGVGGQLLDDAITRHGTPLYLWVFEANDRARALYESRGFVVTDRTDGSGNEEKLPDMRYDLVG